MAPELLAFSAGESAGAADGPCRRTHYSLSSGADGRGAAWTTGPLAGITFIVARITPQGGLTAGTIAVWRWLTNLDIGISVHAGQPELPNLMPSA